MNFPVFDLHCDTALELLGKHLGLFEKAAEDDPKAESLLQTLLEALDNGELIVDS